MDGPERSQAEGGSVGDTDELFSEITRLTALNRARGALATERQLLQLGYLAGRRLADANQGVPQYVAPSGDDLHDGDGLLGFAPEDLTPQRLRAVILRDGCIIVRGLVDRDVASGFAAQIDRAFHERDRKEAGEKADRRYYEKFTTEDAAFRRPVRSWVKEAGGLLAVDSPMLAFELLDMLETAGVPQLVAGYLGESAVLSVDKTTFRKVEPTLDGAWHQDGTFLGDVRALNLWLSLSHCGEDAPGLDIVPRRLDELVPAGGEGTQIPIMVTQAAAEEAAGGLGIARPVFEPGDALLFDHLCLHKTASEASMGHPRFAVESWFFGASAFPDDYSPIAVAGGRLGREG